VPVVSYRNANRGRKKGKNEEAKAETAQTPLNLRGIYTPSGELTPKAKIKVIRKKREQLGKQYLKPYTVKPQPEVPSTPPTPPTPLMPSTIQAKKKALAKHKAELFAPIKQVEITPPSAKRRIYIPTKVKEVLKKPVSALAKSGVKEKIKETIKKPGEVIRERIKAKPGEVKETVTEKLKPVSILGPPFRPPLFKPKLVPIRRTSVIPPAIQNLMNEEEEEEEEENIILTDEQIENILRRYPKLRVVAEYLKQYYKRLPPEEVPYFSPEEAYRRHISKIITELLRKTRRKRKPSVLEEEFVEKFKPKIEQKVKVEIPEKPKRPRPLALIKEKEKEKEKQKEKSYINKQEPAFIFYEEIPEPSSIRQRKEEEFNKRYVSYDYDYAPDQKSESEFDKYTSTKDVEARKMYTINDFVWRKRTAYTPNANIPLLPVPPLPDATVYNYSPETEVVIAPTAKITLRKTEPKPLVKTTSQVMTYLQSLYEEYNYGG